MPDLTVESKSRGDVVVVAPHGFVNAHTVKEFERELRRAVDAGRVRIVISGAGLAYIASAGLGVIMGLIEEVRARGGDIRLCDLNDTVRNIFDVLGFHHLCRIYDTEPEAVDSYGAAV